MPPGPGTEELDINSSETILLCDELGVEWSVKLVLFSGLTGANLTSMSRTPC
jgi:hypothetical protein